jgi:hypothetical protein
MRDGRFFIGEFSSVEITTGTHGQIGFKLGSQVISSIVMCRTNPSRSAPLFRSSSGFSILLSFANLVPTLAIWAAGSHKLGPISRIWQLFSVPGLVFVSLMLLLASVVCLRRGVAQANIWRSVAAASVLAVCAAPLGIVVMLIVGRKLLGAN